VSPDFERAILAVVGALLEILPLSRSGHEALASLLLSVSTSPVSARLSGAGAALGAIVYFRKRIEHIASARRSPPGGAPVAPGKRSDAALMATSTVGFLVVDVGLRGHAAAWAVDPELVGATLLVMALALASTLWAREGDRDAPGLLGALVVGCVQGAAVLPGLSRIGVGLVCLLWLGVRTPRVLELCVLLLMPGWLVSLAFGHGRTMPPASDAWAAHAATLVAAAVIGFWAVRVVDGAVRRRLVPLFSLYLLPLALATLAFGYARA
jgi:undecaprenyl-diphosphatase